MISPPHKAVIQGEIKPRIDVTTLEKVLVERPIILEFLQFVLFPIPIRFKSFFRLIII
jgi:hypothetical protein